MFKISTEGGLGEKLAIIAVFERNKLISKNIRLLSAFLVFFFLVLKVAFWGCRGVLSLDSPSFWLHPCIQRFLTS